MRIFIVDTFYGPYLERLYAGGLAQQPWAEQHKAHFAGGFGTGDAYSHGLGLLGVPAIEIVANSPVLQQAWAREHQPELLQLEQGAQQLFAILEAQIRWWKPSVLYVQDINWIPAAFLQHVKPLVEMVVGQNACPLAPGLDLSPYDLLCTAVPHYVDRFRKTGVEAEYLPIGFDTRLLNRYQTNAKRNHCLTFVGGLGGYHRQGTEVLELIARDLPLRAWGYGGERLPEVSYLRKCWRGEAWAEEMYMLLAQSRITLNRHIDIAQGYACNMRLYEATGMGACLVTDNKANLSSLFQPDEEIVTFESPEEAISKIKELIEKPILAEEIAKKGQARTLKEHSYQNHMGKLLKILHTHKSLCKSEGLLLRSSPKNAFVHVFAKAKCFSDAKKWADIQRSKTSGFVDFAFLVDGKINSQGERVWMPISEDNGARLVKSFFDSTDASGALAIFSQSLIPDNDIFHEIIKEAERLGFKIKHIAT